MTMNEYQVSAKKFINNDLDRLDWEHHALHGIVGEIGELHSIYQKIYQGHEFDKAHIKKELGDIMWFLAEYVTAMGWDLDDIARTNIKKLSARYPDGFTEERSLHRKDGDL